ncbi:MAG: cation:proton antiporter [Cyanobacteria bacterium P01_C01_bin.120]
MIKTIEHLLAEPFVTFAILLAVTLSVPVLFERLRLPGLVGLLAAGIILGPHSLQVLNPEDPIIQLLSDVGLLYLMFVAGLEIDMQQFQKMKYRSAGFGSLTFFLPLMAGTAIGYFNDFSWASSILIGSLIASHSLLTYPILSQFGVTRNKAVITGLGATIFTDIGALIVLAVCVSVGEGDFSTGRLLGLLIGLGIYAIAILVGFNRLGQIFLRRSDNNQGNQFLFILLVIFIAAFGAEVIGVEKIVGAFLAGLAVNEVVGNCPVKEKIVFVGTVLFIPIFFVDIGLLIDVPAFFSSPQALRFAAIITVALLLSKFLATVLAKFLYRYDLKEMWTMWGMTLPQVATTLAAALVGNRAGLINEDVLNSVVVMMLITSVLGPVLVRQTAKKLPLQDEPLPVEESDKWILSPKLQSFTVLVPVHNPHTEPYLIELAALIAKEKDGVVKPLAIANAQAQMDSPRMNSLFAESEALLQKAVDIGQAMEISIEPLLRIDRKVTEGINHVAKEQRAQLVIMGLGHYSGFKERLFGNLIDDVLWASHCPVAITQLHQSPKLIRSILVPVKRFTASEIHKVQLAIALAQHREVTVTILHITSTSPSPKEEERLKEKMLKLTCDNIKNDVEVVTQVIYRSNIARAILQESKSHELMIMRTRRRRTNAGGLAIGNVSSRIIPQLKCSLILLGEPNAATASSYAPISQPESLAHSSAG